MYRMYGMSRCHGWRGATNVQDVRYVAVPWKDNYSCIIFIPHIRVGKGKERRMYRMYGMLLYHGKIIAPAFSLYPASMRVKASSDACPWRGFRKSCYLLSRPAGEIFFYSNSLRSLALVEMTCDME